MLCMKHDAGDCPAAKQNHSAIFRSLRRPQAEGLKHSVISSLGVVEVESERGVYLGKAVGYRVDLERLFRVIRRTVAGLYYHEFGSPLPQTCSTREVCLDNSDPRQAGFMADYGGLFRKMCGGPGKTFADGAFSYWFKGAIDCPHAIIWVLEFYQATRFVCIVAPKEEA